MKRQIAGLSHACESEIELPDGEYLVRVSRARYRWDKNKPYYVIRFEVLEPPAHSTKPFQARVYCTVKALWKLNWFLRDFGYDAELLGRDELDERGLSGLTGVVRISNKIFNGHTVLNLDAFAPAERWAEMFGTSATGEEAA
jgi:hypothetical protein